MTVIAWVPDLMDRSRFPSGVEFATDPTRLSEPADLVIVDLARLSSLEILASIGAPTIGFAPHVDGELAEAARLAGCDDVLARSVFFRRVADIVAGAG